MSPENSVYLYRNGIADFRRSYSVGISGQKVSIPVKENQVGDVLASIDYFGKVKLTKPPGYSPKDNRSTLSIDAADPFGSALKAFSGAEVAFIMKSGNVSGNKVTGTLVGVEVVEENTPSGVIVPKKYVGLYTSKGFENFSLRDDIRAVQFLSDADKAEFTKALARNYQKIKPGSTFIDLTLTPTTNNEEDVVLQYALPVAAWNMSYRLKQNNAGRWTIDGHAVVHNSTDFDWTSMRVSVVTGEPTTFEHDLADAKIPGRGRVNVTSERAYGAVSIEEGSQLESVGASRGLSKGFAPTSASSPSVRMAASSGHSFAMSGGGGGYESMTATDSDEDYFLPQRAEMDMADASTVGDFLILSSPNLADIAANQSALVPMFSKELDEAERVFYYKPANDLSFPFSAIKFKNTTGMPLTKGIATVSIEGHNAGEAVLEAAKPGDVRLLAHTLESGIKITRGAAKIESQTSLVKINEGNIYTEIRSLSNQSYAIRNKLEEDVTLLIEHPWNVTEPVVTVKLDGEEIDGLEKISQAVRFTIKCKAGQSYEVSVNENKLDTSTTTFDGGQFRWIAQQGYFDKDEAFLRVSSIQEEISRIEQEKRELEAKKQMLAADQAKYNNFLANASGDNKNRWETSIGSAEDDIKAINATHIPQREKELREVKAKMTQALKDLKTSWKPNTKEKAA